MKARLFSTRSLSLANSLKERLKSSSICKWELKGGEGPTHPDRTPSTRFRTKKEPMMMRGMKYIQFQVVPKASLVWKHHIYEVEPSSAWFDSAGANSAAHVVEDSRPSLHGDALEDGEHGKQDVVKLRDAVVGADPGISAFILVWTFPHSARKRQLWGVHSLVVCRRKQHSGLKNEPHISVIRITEILESNEECSCLNRCCQTKWIQISPHFCWCS